MQRIIFHIDVNSAFLSWEAAYRLKHLGGSLDLRSIPSAVGGDPSKRHGIILAKSIPAKAYGIHTGESVPEALRKCPSLMLVPPNYGLYETCSRAFMEILREYSDTVEQYSIDEAFVDMTGTQLLFGKPLIAANALKDRIRQELGFTVNVGISCNKLLAKMAGELQKPDQVHTLFPEEIPDKLWPLPVGELFFVGKASEKKLRNLGIHTIGELAGSDVTLLRANLKKYGELIWNLANGRDMQAVEPVPPANKGYGNSTTVAFDVCDRDTACRVLLSLAETVGRRLRRDGARIRVVSVSLKFFDFSHIGHQCVLEQPTDLTREIYQTAVRLFEELWDGTPIRHMGIHTSQVAEGGARQLSLFDPVDYEKWERLDHAIDDIRSRFGADAVMRASFACSGGTERKKPAGWLDHMAGGISREKRTVDYSRENIM